MLRVMQVGAHLLFFLLLSVGIVRAVADSDHPAPVVSLAAVVAAWYLCGIWFVRRRGLENGEPIERRLGQLWFAVLVVGWLMLMLADANFVWLAFALFFLCFPLFSTPIALTVTAVLTGAAIAATLWHGTTNTAASIVGPVFGAAAAAGMAVVYQQLVRQSTQRQQLVDELTEAHRELLDAQDELVALQRETGALAERSRLARDIHDTLAQGFSSILLLSRAGQRGPGDPTAIFTQIAETAQQNLVEARRVVEALAPAALETAPLQSALRRLLDQLQRQTGITAELITDGETMSPIMDYDVALLRVAQSALANVRLHSQARRVRATLSYSSDEVRLDIVDDGIGFDQREAGGFGLRSMRDRLAELGGTLVVESAPGDGTAVAATLPIGRSA
ncbi:MULTISPECIES: sensor histidine kinase [Gordonia]|uniref:sensor histidine kinase n=1 Tax=Gordonia TaxID=2053 RepID=UPI000421E701|nr:MULTISPECIES: sensor histidine kinase [Gordonia]MDH3008566.1 sensor histidine kinase [Gordonia alkanivorans]MDH3017746.1 sensor histidine kinase [Gordonia alkanivorans]MDH3043097.1 sensor histidine kinase [Gordonia alkanivorans]MDH3060349.1 sensor histidine kinase [Gordonia alkanivorans]OLT48510.1 two-component sensor histidine kinase [Gordonia sp. CNJ-863]